MVVLFACPINLTCKKGDLQKFYQRVVFSQSECIDLPNAIRKMFDKISSYKHFKVNRDMGLLVCKSVNLSFMNLSLYMYGQNPIK